MRIKPSKIIQTLKANDYDAKKTASQLGIHKATVYRWIIKARSIHSKNLLSSHNLKRKSTKPKSVHYALNAQQRLDIVNLRKKEGYNAHKLKKILNLDASVATINRFLKKRSLLRDYGYHRRPRFQDTKHMHLNNTKTIGFLQMDVKYSTPELSGLDWTCYEYAVIDIYSRYKEAVILNQLDQDGSISALMEILPKLPFKPTFIQTDNGLEFQKRFVDYVTCIGLEHHFTHKRSPNENAVIERSFRTDEEEFFFRLEKRPEHYDELREWFARYINKYNTYRPHHGINLRTPMEVVANVMRH